MSDGSLECARLLLDRGTDINLPRENGLTALMIACSRGHLDTASLLCERDASLDLQRGDGATALYFASNNNHLECAHLLCTSGANTLLSFNGWTPFARASAQFGAASTRALLLQTYPH